MESSNNFLPFHASPVTETTETARVSRVLQTDDNSQIRLLEQQFVEKHKLIAYNDNLLLSPKDTVFNSRTLNNANYVYKYDAQADPLTVDTDFDEFSTVGTTLTVNNELTYLRYAAWDLDCPCKKQGSDISYHLNELHVTSFVDVLKKHFVSTYSFETVECVIFTRQCGFHVYTNIPVSLNYHTFLTETLLKAQFGHKFVIEVPQLMPVPYSAKIPGKCYQPLFLSNGNSPVPITYNEVKFFDNFTYTKKTLSLGEGGNQAGGMRKKLGSLIGNEKLFIYETSNAIWKGTNETSLYEESLNVRFTPSSVHDHKYTLYLHFVKNSSQHNSFKKNAHYRAVSPSLTTCDVQERSISIDRLWKLFLNFFKDTYYHYSLEPAEIVFINKSFIDNGSLNLVHYLVGAVKYMKKLGFDLDANCAELSTYFKTNVYSDYYRVPDSSEKEDCTDFSDDDDADDVALIHHILDNLDLSCIEPFYSSSYDFIFTYLTENDVLDIYIDDDPKTVITKLINSRNSPTIDGIDGIVDKRDKRKQTLRAIDIYLDILYRRRYLIRDEKNWYIYKKNGAYDQIDGNKKIEASMLYGIGYFNDPADFWSITDRIAHTHQEFLTTISYCKCEFLISTQIGVFNSILGLFMTNSPILLFITTHNRSNYLWTDPEKQKRVSNRLNYSLLEILMRSLMGILYHSFLFTCSLSRQYWEYQVYH